MNEKHLKDILGKISNIKKELGFEIIDTHVHPYDVMGVVHSKDVKDTFSREDYLKPGILEKFKYGKIEKIGSKVIFRLFPDFINTIIKSSYAGVNEKRILEEMESALVDKAVLVPIEPWLSTGSIADNFKNERFIILGSLDIHRIGVGDIESIIGGLIEKYHIVGLKLHPNLQNFKPQPSHNGNELAEKLHKIYSVAESKRLYVLFHGGVSHYTNTIDSRYGDIKRSRTNAILKNFCNRNGDSELFGKYNIPIVIAHLGHYGIAGPDYALMKLITEKFDNVYFDTTGSSPDFIKKALRLVSSKKIVFGSDAIYNRMAYGLAFLYLGARGAKNGERLEDILLNVLQQNFLNIISW